MTTQTSAKATGLTYLQVQDNLEWLKLTSMLSAVDRLAEKATKGQWSYTEFLGRLREEEMAARQERRLTAKQCLAHFPWVKTLDQFHFSFQPSLDEKKVKELAT